MKKRGVISLCATAVALVCSEWSLLFAQVAANLASGPRDVVYAQSELLRSLDDSWYRPLSRSHALTPTTRDVEYIVLDSRNSLN